MRNTRRALAVLPILLILLLVTTAVAFAAGEGDGEVPSRFYQTFWSLLPAVIAIGLALVTKEVYTSLFVGILVGGLLYSNFNFEGTLTHIFNDGFVGSLADSYNVGILVFLVILGILVVLMNKAGGSAAFGRWAAAHIKTRAGAQLSIIALGVLIFVDDYFNCLTVGPRRRPCASSRRCPPGPRRSAPTWRTGTACTCSSRPSPSTSTPSSPSP